MFATLESVVFAPNSNTTDPLDEKIFLSGILIPNSPIARSVVSGTVPVIKLLFNLNGTVPAKNINP